jgi:hypothetical protein
MWVLPRSASAFFRARPLNFSTACRQPSPLFLYNFQALSVFRIAFAAYLLVHFFILEWPLFSDFYGDDGMLPAGTLTADHDVGYLPIWDVLKSLDSIGVPALLPILYPTALLAFAIGYQMRWTKFIVFVLSSYTLLHNVIVFSGAELLSHLLLVWCLFLPLARYWSVDAALDLRARDRYHPFLPFLALRLQIASVYFFAGLFKLSTPSWLNGSAVLWALQDNIFGGRNLGLYLVRNFPQLLSLVTELTVAFQLMFPLLVYWPRRNDLTRGFAIFAAAAMHITFATCLMIGPFPYISLTMLVLLIPDHWIESVLHARRARLGHAAIYYESGCSFCQRLSLLLREFLLAPSSAVVPASTNAAAQRLLNEERSWVVQGHDGAMYTKSRALAYLLRQNSLFAPLGWLILRSVVEMVGDRVYDLIGRHRRTLGRVTKIVLPFRSPPAPGLPAQLLCGWLAALALAMNICTIERPAFGAAATSDQPIHFAHRAPRWLVELAVDFQVWQGWPLFTPPPHWHREYHMTATGTNGASFDLMESLPMPPLRLEPNGRLIFADTRWQKLFTQLNLLTERDWASFGKYLCRLAQENVLSSIVGIELSTSTRPIAGTPSGGMPAPLHRHFECVLGKVGVPKEKPP